jgi:hypothetical protein
MKTIKSMALLFLIATSICHPAISQVSNTTIKQEPASTEDIYEMSKKVTEIMKGVSLVPRSTATKDDKELLKKYQTLRALTRQMENAKGNRRATLGQEIQLVCWESNSIAKLRLTGRITLFPGDCYDNCDDGVGAGAAWNEFFCVFKCFKAATVNFD